MRLGAVVAAGILAALAGPAFGAVPGGDRGAALAALCDADTERRIAAVQDLLRIAMQDAEGRDFAARTLDDTAKGRLACEPPGASRPLFVNLRLRAHLETAIAEVALLGPGSASERLAAARAIERQSALASRDLLEEALDTERDGAVRGILGLIVALRDLHDPSVDRRIAAIQRVADTPSGTIRTTLAGLLDDQTYSAEPRVRAALVAALAQVDRWLAIGTYLAIGYGGLSYASVLFMAALGLAIIFGLMGVINLAQGELIMLGAYATFFTQRLFQAYLPSHLDWYLVAAIPAAFLVSAGIGIAMEVSVVRHLYRRPLMSLLATWGLSLFLVNAVRLVVGTQNLEFVQPSYVSGGVPIVGDFIVTFNRLFAILFAGVVFGVTVLVLRKTTLGLYIRAVTGNRAMAGCVGVSTRAVDMLAFGLGSGLAGLGGLVMSQIYNVNPTMGAGYIVDAFMVVVLGGMGQLAGTAIASLGIGQINHFIEPFYGAVAAKAIGLLLIILFIQWRPEGIFVAKGRR